MHGPTTIADAPSVTPTLPLHGICRIATSACSTTVCAVENFTMRRSRSRTVRNRRTPWFLDTLNICDVCRVLSEHGCSIAPFTYYEARNRPASRRSVRDEELEAEVSRVHAEQSSVYGARKVWLEMRRQGIEVARCTVERLMGVLELQGARRGKTKRTTIADAQGRRADDLVQRKFNPGAPNML